MFTGLVEGLGTVHRLQSQGGSLDLWITAPDLAGAAGPSQSQIGDSIAINGCCLTLVEMSSGQWMFQAGAETLKRTNLGHLQLGDLVNIERSLPVNGRLGGHFVQGHIDGLATVDDIQITGLWRTIRFRVARDLTEQMVSKGSIAIDGVSLTLVSVDRESFSVMLIPHTLDMTTLGRRQVGDAVNVETDILGKYAQKLLAGVTALPF